jgi:hypothetical protein
MEHTWVTHYDDHAYIERTGFKSIGRVESEAITERKKRRRRSCVPGSKMQITDAGMGLPEAIWANATQSRAADLEQLQDGRRNEEQETEKETERQICKKKGLSHPKSQSST